MLLDSRQARLIRLIATGSTLKNAALTLNLSTERTRQILARACRELGLLAHIAAIQSNAQAYLEKLPAEGSRLDEELRPALRYDLIDRLGLDPAEEVVPREIAKYSATQLGKAGFSGVAIAEIQQWLRSHGMYLKHYGTLERDELRALTQALYLLDAYHLNVVAAKEQLEDEAEAMGNGR